MTKKLQMWDMYKFGLYGELCANVQMSEWVSEWVEEILDVVIIWESVCQPLSWQISQLLNQWVTDFFESVS